MKTGLVCEHWIQPAATGHAHLGGENSFVLKSQTSSSKAGQGPCEHSLYFVM